MGGDYPDFTKAFDIASHNILVFTCIGNKQQGLDSREWLPR